MKIWIWMKRRLCLMFKVVPLSEYRIMVSAKDMAVDLWMRYSRSNQNHIKQRNKLREKFIMVKNERDQIKKDLDQTRRIAGFRAIEIADLRKRLSRYESIPTLTQSDRAIKNLHRTVKT